MTSKHNSRIAGFYNLSLEERHKEILENSQLTAQELADLTAEAGLSPAQSPPLARMPILHLFIGSRLFIVHITSSRGHYMSV